ncbi:MAG: hypothetical protein GYB65_10280 [Chloroflexi bacterium]|nr:hypothetical protein [Chloroflexota bacterium]
MNRRNSVFICALLVLSVVLVGTESTVAAQTDSAMPYYIIAIHCEPFPLQAIPENYVVLQEMVAYADAYDIKLTVMFTAQWADYIAADPARLAEAQGWMANGHEIAAHHHSIFHSSWDNYTDFDPEAVEAAGFDYDYYQGSLDDYLDVLYQVNPAVQSGCVNDEHSKQSMPDGIIYDMCSGFANFGEPGRRMGDDVAQKGISEYITAGNVNGITRRWLTHFQIYQNPFAAIDIVNEMDSGVYGVATHAVRGQDQPLYIFMDFLHSRDPEGAMSRTTATAIEESGLPEIELPDVVINGEFDVVRPRPDSPCGDGVCDDVEQAQPDLCPQDCD